MTQPTPATQDETIQIDVLLDILHGAAGLLLGSGYPGSSEGVLNAIKVLRTVEDLKHAIWAREYAIAALETERDRLKVENERLLNACSMWKRELSL